MQFGEHLSSPRINRRSRERRGLEAIFTSERAGRKREFLTGAVGIIGGLFLSVLALFRGGAPKILGPLAAAVYSSLTFGAVGALLLICGCGILTFAIGRREAKLSNNTVSPIDGPSGVDDLGDVVSHNATNRMFGLGSRISAVAFVQSLVLVLLYSGFVQEFDSNVTMQMWVRSNFPVGQSVLNWEGVLILSVSLGILLVQFLPGRFFSE